MICFSHNPRRVGALLLRMALVGLTWNAHAQSGALPPSPSASEPSQEVRAEPRQALEQEQFSVHGQLTNVTQQHPTFRSPYVGPNSLPSSEQATETVDMTLFLGLRLWSGAEFYLSPELEQGYGLAGTLGMAGFPSGEAYKIGSWTPYYRLPRVFVRQTFALAGDEHPVGAGVNALAGSKADNNVTLTVGKFSVVDIFDTNAYAHDPRADFLNWAVIESGAFDYAADSWGDTLGAAIEWTQADWTLRGGYFALSTMPNGESLQTNFSQNSMVAEVEYRGRLLDRPGAIRFLAFVDRGSIARYDDALTQAIATHSRPDPGSVRRGGSKSGYAMNLEQELCDSIGAFARFSGNNGRYEAIEFSEINRSLATGLSMKGTPWNRQGDTLGLAAAINDISPQARAYLAAGGNGILIGDGQLPHYAREQIVEVYYAARLNPHLTISADVQHIANPAYNADRGPVKVFGLRLHAEL